MASLMDYREMLRLELVVRQIRNPKYSLRAFARDCKISPSRFSEVLRKKNNLSLQSGRKIASYLGLSTQVTRHFVASIAFESNRLDSRLNLKMSFSNLEAASQTREDLAPLQEAPVRIWQQEAMKEIIGHRNFSICKKWIPDIEIFSGWETFNNFKGGNETLKP